MIAFLKSFLRRHGINLSGIDHLGVRHVFAECVFAPDTVFPHTDFFELNRVLTGFGFCFVASYAESFRLSDGCALGNVLYSLKSRLPASAPGRVKNIY